MVARLSRRKLWLFRLVALVVAPLALLGGLEVVLRLAGSGYDTQFLKSVTHEGRELRVPNNQFGWRFFGPELARWPYPFALPPTKATNTVRIFVLGESAARGEPVSEFGLPRVLDALLSLKFPGVQFEVVNVAMTAINSHAIVSIARDCARADGDIWVVYMGNNEVVGPFGAGTLFGPQSPPLALIRANLALKTTRTGQLLDATLKRVRPPAAAAESGWGGMGMFLEQQVPAGDPRLASVYDHFAANLTDIIRTGRRRGVGIVVSTVAVNLKDCPPFASQHRPGLSEADLKQWNEHYAAGCQAAAAAQWAPAAAHFAAAARMDDTFADLLFRQARCALALGESSVAQEKFQRARDCDALRFRCDSRLNEITRQLVNARGDNRVRLVDAERRFAEESADHLPGREFFYEHVHLTFAGNYLLARLLADEILPLLPDGIAEQNAAPGPWPTSADCARRLGRTDWHEAAAVHSVISSLQSPPFTGQIDHRDRLRELEATLQQLSPALTPAGIAESSKVCAAALGANPRDAILHRQLAVLRRATGDFEGAVTALKAGLALLPNDSEGWSLLGQVLLQQQQFAAAETAFRRAYESGAQGLKARLDLARVLPLVGKSDEALAMHRKILAERPNNVPALLQLGQLVEKLGRREAAADYYQKALANRRPRAPELAELGDFFQQRRDFQPALTAYSEAVELNPDDPLLHLNVARCLAALARYPEATRHTTEAIRLAPERAEIQQLHGIVLLKQGRKAEALGPFREALRLAPQSLDNRLNLGVALAESGQTAEAITHLTVVVQSNPTNAGVLKLLETLRAKPSATP